MHKKKGARHEVEIPKRKPEEPDLSKRSKIITPPPPPQILETNRAPFATMLHAKEIQKDLLKAANFNKDKIHIRLIFLKEIGNIWTLCITIMN